MKALGLCLIVGCVLSGRAAPVSARGHDDRGAATRALPGDQATLALRRLFAWVACGSVENPPPPPSQVGGAALARHCAKLKRQYRISAARFARARRWLDGHRPSDAPSRVVYPFGGGDLLFALLAFPDAEEITTISLERAGDVSSIEQMTPQALRQGMRAAAWMIKHLTRADFSFTVHMRLFQKQVLPVQLTMALGALALLGREPLSVRYFRIAADGTLHYRNDDDPAMRTARGSFANVELTFTGRDGKPSQTYRHVWADLSNAGLAQSPALLAHLRRKGSVSAITKAASYLLWSDEFSTLRTYLLERMRWMISDSTGVLPQHARAAGFSQTTYGRFGAPRLRTRVAHRKDMLRLFQSQPRRSLPFRFGYTDKRYKAAHVIITRAASSRSAP